MYSSDTTEPTPPRHTPWPIDLDIDALASRRLSATAGRALPGRCRGTVLARWAGLCRDNFGDAAFARIRAGIDSWLPHLPDAPTDNTWFPVGAQVELTDAVIDMCLGGDPRPLQDMLARDVDANVGRLRARLLRSLGPGPVLARARAIHAHLYDVGRATARVHGKTATIVSEGTALFGHPTWQLLQLFAHRGLVALTGRELRALHASMPAKDAFRVDVAWD